MKMKEIVKIKIMKRKLGYIIVIVFWLIVAMVLSSCEKNEFIEESPPRLKPDVSAIEKFCCDWDAVNYEPYVNGICVTEAYFRNSRHCDNSLCVYPNY